MSYNFTFPAIGQADDPRQLLAKIWMSQADPIVPDFAMFGKSVPGVVQRPHTPGGQLQSVLYSVGSRAYGIRPGDGPGAGGSSGSFEILTNRTDHYVEKKDILSKKDLDNVPAAMQRMPQMRTEQFRRVGQVFDRRMLIAAQLAARDAALNSTAATGSLMIHQGGTVVTRSSGSGAGAAPATAIAAAYPRTSTGGTRAYDDFMTLAANAENKFLSPANAVIYPHIQLKHALLEYKDATLFSKDYIDEQVGNSIVRRTVETIAGFRVGGYLFFDIAGGGEGHLPTGDLSAGGNALHPSLPSNLFGNFSVQAGAGPAAMICVGMGASNGDAGAVEFMVHDPVTPTFKIEDEEYVSKFWTYGDITIGKVNPANAAALEVVA